MAATIAAGLGYSWSCLGVPTPVLQQVADVCSQLLGRPLACQPPQPSGQVLEQQQDQPQRPLQQQQQQQQDPQQPQQPQQQCQVGAKRPPPCSPGSLAAAAAEVAEPGPAAAGAAVTAAAGDEPVDMLDVLLAAGHKLREVKEAHFPEISYGWLRLALAHLGRCNPGPWD